MSAAAQSRDVFLRGTLRVHPRGFGFVIVEEPTGHEDVFIPWRRLNGALHGDRVEVELDRRRARRGSDRGPRGRVRRILQRSPTPVIGKVIGGHPAYLLPDDPRHPNPIPIDKSQQPPQHCIVSARIQSTDPPMAFVVDVLGRDDDPELPLLVACARHQIPLQFPEEVEEAAGECRPPGPEELVGRRDLRSLLTVTIDGADARDFDDAVSIEPLPKGGWRLWVHIADVAHYVVPGGNIDLEALARGTSVYFPDRAVAMLPERLSNDLCSLRPETDRLTLTVQIEFDGQGRRQTVEFFESAIHSDARLTYERVAGLTAGGKAPGPSEKPLLPALEAMLELSRHLRRLRLQRGAIDFDIPEPEVLFDDEGEVVGFRRRARLPPHQLIEEFMLQANEAVAAELTEAGADFPYRVHERPEEKRLESFESVAAHFGLTLGLDTKPRLHGRDVQRFLARLEKRPELDFLGYLLLRSFERARYDNRNVGHFGLAADCYTHFTSPIRRYPDLVVHRLLKARMAGRPQRQDGRVAEVARHSSERERAAADAENEVVRVLMARWMSERVGEEFSGIITGVGRWGLAVQLPESLIEGRVLAETLPGRLRFDPDRLRLAGRHRSYQIGDRIRVVVLRAETDTGRVEFGVAP